MILNPKQQGFGISKQCCHNSDLLTKSIVLKKVPDSYKKISTLGKETVCLCLTIYVLSLIFPATFPLFFFHFRRPRFYLLYQGACGCAKLITWISMSTYNYHTWRLPLLVNSFRDQIESANRWYMLLNRWVFDFFSVGKESGEPLSCILWMFFFALKISTTFLNTLVRKIYM